MKLFEQIADLLRPAPPAPSISEAARLLGKRGGATARDRARARRAAWVKAHCAAIRNSIPNRTDPTT